MGRGRVRPREKLLMSSNVVIQCEGLGKSYRLGGKRTAYKTLRDSITDLVRRPGTALGRLSVAARAERDERFWALRDVAFNIRDGEVVGIIGHNGAGKSTLLKILSRIVAPTEGRIVIHGRVGALLEVGTGFNPELTGRENVFMNGAILGMTRAEILRKFDEIVAFAGVEKFIDTPVKHYSSGMGLRLGFAVAAHLEPEILVVDEVLAVGDAEFQNKCMGKMQDVANEGRTVLFVSHNLGAVRTLCTRGILLKAGQVVHDGTSDSAIQAYLAASARQNVTDLREHPNRRQGAASVVADFRIVDTDGQRVESVILGQPLRCEILLEARSAQLPAAHVGLLITDRFGQDVCEFNSTAQLRQTWDLQGRRTVRCVWDVCHLMPGSYTISLAFRSGETKDAIDKCFQFSVLPSDIFGTGRSSFCKRGLLVPNVRWDVGDVSGCDQIRLSGGSDAALA